MASRLGRKIITLNHGEHRVTGSLRPQGSSALVATDSVGNGWTAARTSVGLYTVTFADKWNNLIAFNATARDADGLPCIVTAGDYSAANKTMQLRVSRGLGEMALDLGSAREAISNDVGVAADAAARCSGSLLGSDTTPAYIRVNAATDKALRYVWASSNSDEVMFSPIPMLPSMSGANNIEVHLLARMAGSTDTPTIDVQAWDGVGDTEMGGATAALTAAVAEYSVAITAANLGGHPTGFLNVQLVPGAHTTDALWLYAAWLEWSTLVDLADDVDNVINFEAVFGNASFV